MQEMFITADLHLGHDAIRRHTNRPFMSVEQMDAALIANWNNTVPRKGTVIVVGDFAWKDHAKYLNRLHGKKILIVGNHDKMNQAARSQFTEVHHILCRVFQKKPAVFCHYPMLSWPGSTHGSWHLCGHSHGTVTTPEHVLRLDVGVDVFEYKPIPWFEIMRIMAQKETARKEWLKSRGDRERS